MIPPRPLCTFVAVHKRGNPKAAAAAASDWHADGPDSHVRSIRMTPQ
jgi:hypothetical protein